MRICPNCNELNGDNRTECFKCKTSLGPIDKYKKICVRCGIIYSQRTENCDQCGDILSVYNDNINAGVDNSHNNTWLYVVSVLIPLLGIILGCIYIARREDDLGKSLIITSVISNIIAVILLWIL